MRRIAFYILFILLILPACAPLGPKAAPSLNLAPLYNPSRMSLHPDFIVYHDRPEQSTLFMRAFPAELLFSQANTEGELRAVIDLNYKLYFQVPDSGYALLDTASVRYKLTGTDKDRTAWMTSLPLNLEVGGKYLLQLTVMDMQRGSLGFKQLTVDKTDNYSAQNFKVISAFSGYPKFMNFFLPGEAFFLQYNDHSMDTVYVDYFSRNFELPRPPLNSLAEYRLRATPDTTLIFPLSDTTVFRLEKSGMYRFRVDPDHSRGLTLFNFGSSFPNTKTSDDLLEPIFYLSTLTEYRDLRTQANRKLAVDDFWLRCGNSIDRSRELIRVYYNRVLYANLYFSSDREGWKTDRGMMLILLGPPDRVNIRNTDEIWYYNSRKMGKVIELVFELQEPQFAMADYIWKRSPEGWSVWNEAVKSWRNGKVFTLSD